MRFAPAFFVPAALVLAHCSSPVPATPDAAWVVNLSSGGAACAINLSTVPFGDSNINNTTIQTRVTDGEVVKNVTAGGQTGTAHVTCAVVPLMAGGFQVQAQTSIGADSLAVNIDKIDKSATKDQPATGHVTYLSDKTVSTYAGDCKFYFVNGEGVDSGKFWASFTCDGLTYASNPPSTCPILESYMAFESCLTTPLN